MDVVTFNQVTDIEFLRSRGSSRRTGRSACRTTPRRTTRCRCSSCAPAIRRRSRTGRTSRGPGVQVVFPNPKTSGNGRYTYLAAYAYALDQNKGDQAKARDFATKLLANVPVFDTGGRGATTTFIEREIGDVLVTFECEVTAIRKEYGKSAARIGDALAQPARGFPGRRRRQGGGRKGSRKVATAYLEYLYTPAGPGDSGEVSLSRAGRGGSQGTCR